eukprot:4223485-Pyramimonas_sp.AAC.1
MLQIIRLVNTSEATAKPPMRLQDAVRGQPSVGNCLEVSERPGHGAAAKRAPPIDHMREGAHQPAHEAVPKWLRNQKFANHRSDVPLKSRCPLSASQPG